MHQDEDNETTTKPPLDDIATLAYRYWQERGEPHGSPEEDWLRAEQDHAERPVTG